MTENWAACVRHVVDKVKPRLWEQDHLMKERVSEFMIALGQNQTMKGTSRRMREATMHISHAKVN